MTPRDDSPDPDTEPEPERDPDGAPKQAEEVAEAEETQEANDPDRRRVTWTYALAVGVAAFGIWLVFSAPTLQHNATAQPVGARRTVSLDTLGPLASLSRSLGASHVVSVADGVLGRNGNTPGSGSGPVTIGPTGTTQLDGPRFPGGRVHDGPAPGVRVPAPRPAPGGPHPVGSATSQPAATTTTGVPDDRHPTAADPLRVLIIGDSLGIDLGDSLQNALADTGIVSATLDAKESTGLTRPDYYNWPAELQSDVARINPQVVVIMVGANDPQDFPGPPDVPYGTDQWNGLYGQRVAQFMQIASSNGAKVIWVGMPPMQDPGRNAAMQNLNGIVAAQAAHQPGVSYLSSWHILGGPQGVFTPYLEVGGQEVNVRDPDGTHIAPGGGDLLAQAVITQMRGGLGISLGS